MLLHIKGKFTMEKLKSSLNRPNCQFRGVGQGMKQTICICDIIYFKLNGIYAINEITNSKIIQRNDIIYIQERDIKGSGQFLFVFLEKSLYNVCLIRLKEQVGEKKSTICSHKYAECLLKNTSNRMFFIQNKICPFLAQGIAIYVGHSFI